MISLTLPSGKQILVEKPVFELWPSVAPFVVDDKMSLLLDDEQALEDIIEISNSVYKTSSVFSECVGNLDKKVDSLPATDTNPFAESMTRLSTDRIWKALRAADYLGAQWFSCKAKPYLASRCKHQDPDAIIQILHIQNIDQLSDVAEGVLRMLKPSHLFKSGFDEHALYISVIHKGLQDAGKTAHALLRNELYRSFFDHYLGTFFRYSDVQKESLAKLIIQRNDRDFLQTVIFNQYYCDYRLDKLRKACLRAVFHQDKTKYFTSEYFINHAYWIGFLGNW